LAESEIITSGFGAYAHKIPTDFQGNLKFRKDLLTSCHNNRAAQNRAIEICSEDPLFFFNGFCWLYEPRPRKLNGKVMPLQFPMITWDHQVPIVRDIYENIGLSDIGLEKSRGEGASWMAILIALHSWLFRDMQSIGFVSKDENSVDNPEDPDSLFWKLDWELTKLPKWMAGILNVDYKRDRGKHVLKNLRNQSTITGYAATANVGTGGRKSWFFMDELSKFPRGPDADAMASTQHVTNSRLVVGTPYGAEGAYYNLMHEPNNMVRLKLRWQDNPTRNRGLYQFKDGRAVAVDPVNNPLPDDYACMAPDVIDLIERLRRKGFRIENCDRSPWYDRECDRAGATPQNIAQELDIDYGGSAFRIFGVDCMEKVEKSVRAEVLRGDLDFDQENLTPTFDEIENGPFRIWMPLDARRLPPPHPFVIGCDVCSGLGGSYTSNSTMIALDAITGEQVLEFALNTIAPADFADLAIATAKWLNNAYLAWEHNGPGAGFTKRVIERKYGNVYCRTSLSRRKKSKRTEVGFWTDATTKEVMFEALRMSIRSGLCVVRSKEIQQELGQYIRKEQKIFNALSVNAADDSRGASHGDRVIGLGVALMGLKDRPSHTTEEEFAKRQRPPRGSLAEREEEFRRRNEDQKDPWDSRTLADFSRRR
jgi:hypothetical protein